MLMHSLLLATALSVGTPTSSTPTSSTPDVTLGASSAKKSDPTIGQEVGDLNGFYQCKGQEAGGKNYAGVAMILRKNDIYLVQWMVTGGSTFTGVGIRQGNTLAVSWALPNDRGVVRGVNMYRVENTSSGPRLIGRWATLPGPGTLQNETLSYLKKLDPEDE